MNPFAAAKALPRPTPARRASAADLACDEAAILARSLPLVLDELSRRPPFARLPAPAWNVLTQLLATWGLGDRFPTKERVMAAARVSERSARRFLGMLQRMGALRVCPLENRALAYVVGPAIAAVAIAVAAAGDARPANDGTLRPTASATQGAAVRLVPASKKNTPIVAGLPEATLRAAAERALAARHARAYPGAPVPAYFPEHEVDLVVDATAGGSWTQAELDQFHLDAIAGAWPRSRTMPPTVRYIWGTPHYLHQNAADGRAAREVVVFVPTPPAATETETVREEYVTLRENAEGWRQIADALARPRASETTRPLNPRFFPECLPIESDSIEEDAEPRAGDLDRLGERSAGEARGGTFSPDVSTSSRHVWTACPVESTRSRHV